MILSTEYARPYSEMHRPSAHAPPSPPMEQPKCSLPPISSLLGLADAGSPTHESSPISQHPSPSFGGPSRRTSTMMRSPSRPGSGYGYAKSMPPRILPPSPPMSTDASMDQHSPSSTTASQYASHSRHYYETTPPVENDSHRPHLPHPSASRPQSHHQQQPHSTPAAGSYFPPQAPSHQSSTQSQGLHYQQPLPQSFPPMSVPVTVAPSSEAISWQHHHYLNPAPSHLFPQSQDRYICPTCNKAFSRPSSLRIHSHSHTGEKPFKCSQAGCGKAFSVRSNMKRHERGCHSVAVSTGGHVMP